MSVQLAATRSTKIAPTYLVSLEGPNSGIAFVHASTSLGPIEARRLARVHIGMNWNTVSVEVTPSANLDCDVRRAPYLHGRDDAHMAAFQPMKSFADHPADSPAKKAAAPARKMRPS